jgi:hypothetical protein
MLMHAYNPSPQEAKADGLKVLDLGCSLVVEYLPSMLKHLQKKKLHWTWQYGVFIALTSGFTRIIHDFFKNV